MTAVIAWVLLRWRLVAEVTLAAVLTAGAFALGADMVQGKWDRDAIIKEQAEKIALIERIAENAAIGKENDRIRRAIQKGYEDELTKNIASSAALGKLRYSEGFRAAFTLSSASDPASISIAGLTTTGLFPEPYASNLTQLADQMDRITAGCRTGQEYIKRGQHVTQPK